MTKPSSKLVRFGVSLEAELLKAFDRETRRRGYANRSEAIRGLIRERLIREERMRGSEAAGAILLIYDHRRRDLVERLMSMQHDFHHNIISTQHTHLDHHQCLEIVAVRGRPADLQKLADGIRSTKGVKHSELLLTSTKSP